MFGNLSIRPCKISFSPGIGLGFKRSEVKLELLTDIDRLLIVDEGIRGRMSHSINRYAKSNDKYIKVYDNRYILNIWMQIVHMVGNCCKSFQ